MKSKYDSTENESTGKNRKQMQTPRRGCMTHEEAEGAVPEDMAVAGEEDGGAGIQHWQSDNDAEERDADKSNDPNRAN